MTENNPLNSYYRKTGRNNPRALSLICIFLFRDEFRISNQLQKLKGKNCTVCINKHGKNQIAKWYWKIHIHGNIKKPRPIESEPPEMEQCPGSERQTRTKRTSQRLKKCNWSKHQNYTERCLQKARSTYHFITTSLPIGLRLRSLGRKTSQKKIKTMKQSRIQIAEPNPRSPSWRLQIKSDWWRTLSLATFSQNDDHKVETRDPKLSTTKLRKLWENVTSSISRQQ